MTMEIEQDAFNKFMFEHEDLKPQFGSLSKKTQAPDITPTAAQAADGPVVRAGATRARVGEARRRRWNLRRANLGSSKFRSPARIAGVYHTGSRGASARLAETILPPPTA